MEKTLGVTFDDLERWARGSGLEAVLIATGSVLLARVVRWIADRLVARSQNRDARDSEAGLVPSETAKQEGALVLVLERLNVPLSNLVAPATVAAVALGFGAQRLAQDMISGFFIFRRAAVRLRRRAADRPSG